MATKPEAIECPSETPDKISSCTGRRVLSDEEIQHIADDVIDELGELGGDGGIIYATPWGQAGYSFNTDGMYRGRATSDGDKSVAIYGDE